MLRLGTLLIRRLAPLAICALAVAACGSTQQPSATTTTSSAAHGKASTTVAIYSSLPDSGADAAHSRQIETGIRLALRQAHHEVGHFKVDYVRLPCDSQVLRRSTSHRPTGQGKISTGARSSRRVCTGKWNPTAVVANAEQAARNPRTVAYIGELNSGATALSLPILNQAGIVQITPGSGYVGLTNSVTVKGSKLLITQPDEPGKYYPQGLGHRTLLRMIPNDLVQASATLHVLQKAGCQKFSAWNFGGDIESKSLLYAVILTASKYKLEYVSPPPMPAKTSYLTYVSHLVAPTGIHCAVLVGHVTKAAEELTLELREALSLTPTPTIVGTAGFCTRDWVQGIQPSVDRHIVATQLYCTAPAGPVTGYQGQARFISAFRGAYRREPTAYDLYGYVATKMLLRALDDSAGSDDVRQTVLTDMVDDTAPNDVYPAFGFDTEGNQVDSSYAVDDFKRGSPRWLETVSLNAAHLLMSG